MPNTLDASPGYKYVHYGPPAQDEAPEMSPGPLVLGIQKEWSLDQGTIASSFAMSASISAAMATLASPVTRSGGLGLPSHLA